MVKNAVVIGAGVSGLVSAHILTKAGYHVTIIEKTVKQVGVLSKVLLLTVLLMKLALCGFMIAITRLQKFLILEIRLVVLIRIIILELNQSHF